MITIRTVRPCRPSGLMRLGLVALAASPALGLANEMSFGTTTLNWGGYVKADVLYSRFSEGEVAQGGARDFYLPGATPVSAGGGNSYSVLDAHAKETRLFISAKTPYQGLQIGGHIEFDFIVSQGAGNEVITNAYNPGLRRAFLTIDNWLIGQEWSTFQNLGAIPETLDFVAFPSEGTVFDRQTQLRYSHGNWAVALENPETTVNTAGTVAAKNDSQLPDLVLRYIAPLQGGNVGVAVIARQLSIDDASAGGPDDSETGIGISVSGKLPLGPATDFRFMLNHGEGIGRYIGLGLSADAALDGNNELDAIGITAGYVALRQAWSPKWRSTLTYSMFTADNDVALTTNAVTQRVSSASVNLLYSPVPKITTGVEFRHAEREVESGADGSLDRLQFSAKYVF